MQQKWGTFLSHISVNTFMFKMFAVMCFLVWPDDVMTSASKCTTHYEDPPRVFATLSECNQAAYDKLEFTVNIFEENNTDFESIQVGCVPAETTF